MRCEEVLKRLSALSSGDVAPDVRRAMRAHFGECAACRKALERVDGLAAVMAGTRTPPIPSGFAARVMAAARQRQLAGPGAAWNPWRWWRLTTVPIRAAACAVFVVGVVVGLVLGWRVSPSAGPARRVVQGDPLEAYQLDFLSGAPEGSLARSYLTLVSTANGGGR
jgi:transposase InsO family protein